ncbi:MAG: hypothetical protein HYY12_08575 [Candidatus Methylomirabilis oxyfera]|nr:hypothetical protein [Candidatus Methylomirabilis oxyfera]
MKSRRFTLSLLLMAALCLSGCSLWNRVWFAQGEDQKAEKSKAPASSKEQAASAATSQSAKAEKADPTGKTEEKDKKTENPLTESQKEWEEKVTRSPFLVSGDYFRQRDPGGTFDLGFGWLFSKSKEEEQKRKGLEERIAKLEAELAAGGAPAAAPAAGVARTKIISANGRTPVNRVAMVAFEPEAPNPKGFGRIPLEIVASALEKDTRLILVEPPLVDRALRDHGIRPSAANAKQISTLLERDLGTQLVIFLDEATVNSDWDRRGQVQAQVVLKGEIREGVTGHALSLLSAKGAQAGSGSQEALARVEALKQASDQLSSAILKKAVEYEWSARVLSIEDGRVRINAGRRSGLQEGDLLRVFKSDGQEIYHPATKLFVGLDLGDSKGKVRITDFFGSDAAIAKITEGSGFSPNDLLKLDKR